MINKFYMNGPETPTPDPDDLSGDDHQTYGTEA